MEIAQNALDDLWILSTSVAVISNILTTTFLLYVLSFDLDASENEKAGIVMIFFTLGVVLNYSYRQVRKKLKICKSIFEEDHFESHSNTDSSSNPKAGKVESILPSSKNGSKPSGKSCVRRFSFPVQSQEEFCCYCNRPTFNKIKFAPESQLLLGMEPKIAPPTNSSGTCFKNDDFPAILHNCVKKLGEVLEHVKLLNHVCTETLLNHVYSETDEVEDAKQNSMTIFEQINSNNVFREEGESQQSELQSVGDSKRVTNSVENGFSFQPDESQGFDTAEKPIENDNLDSSYQIFSSIEINQLTSKNAHAGNFPGDKKIESFSKSCSIVTEKVEPFLLKIPSCYTSESYSAVNAEVDPNVEKRMISLQFYKAKTPVTQTELPTASLKKNLPKIPMKPYMLSIPERRYIQVNSQKRHVRMISKNEPAVSEHSPIFLENMPIILKKLPIIRKNVCAISMNTSMISNKLPISENLPAVSVKVPISVDEILVSMNKPLITSKKETLITVPLIPRFELTDLENFVDIFDYFVDFYGLYPDFGSFTDMKY